MATIDTLIETRLKTLDELIKNGINPYPSSSQKDYSNKYVIDNFSKLEGKTLTLAGRIMAIRSHGKICFIDVKDEVETIQFFLSKEELKEQFDFYKMLDIGDFIQGTGELFTTSSKNIALKVNALTLLSKSIRPIPSEYFGIKDVEERVRRRHLDLIVDQDTRELFKKLSRFIFSMREFLMKEGFLELDTPVLEHIPGGAEANPFITHHDALNTDFYLRISLELYLKRLIVGGYEKVFEVGKVFRNEGMDRSHLQEFTMMECYWAYADYEKMMDLVERMYKHMLQSTFGTLKFDYRGKTINFDGEWKRLDYSGALKDAGVDLAKYPDTESIRKLARKLELDDDPSAERNRWIDRIYKKLVRPFIIDPTFLINHPVDISPLAKRRADDPAYTERFQVIFDGEEVGNAFSELNDPVDQRKRFEEQQKMRDAGDNEAQMLDEDFLQALEYGMPPTAGFGVGIERFFEIVSNSENIRQVVLFPPTKFED